jgi:probable phosphoglycerate mutase
VQFERQHIGARRKFELGGYKYRTMVQFVLIRPGTSEYDEQGRIQGNLDVPLTQQGELEVQQRIGELRPVGLSVVYSSPARAAWQTASAIASSLGIKAKQIDALQNLDHGLWQGMQLEEVKRKQPKVFRQWQEHPEMVCPPEGETFSACRERVESAIVKLQKKHREGVVGIVAAEPLATIICTLVAQSSAADGKADARSKATAVDAQDVRTPKPQHGDQEAQNAYSTNGAANSRHTVTNPGSISPVIPVES